jgi:hypothetical protein
MANPFLTRSDVDAIDDGDELSAGRMHLELQHQLDQSPDDALGGDDARQTREAVEHLHRRFPDAAKVARHETSERLGGLPRHLRSVQQRERDEAGLTAEDVRDERAAHRKSRDSGGAPDDGGRGRRGGGRPVVAPRPSTPRQVVRRARRTRARARRYGFTPRAMTGGWSQLALDGFVTAVGLSLFYLLLTRGKAVAAISTGFGQAFAKLVSPQHDLFGGASIAAPQAGFTLDELAGLTNVTGLPLDTTGLPTLTARPPTVPKVNRPRAPAHATPTRITTP